MIFALKVVISVMMMVVIMARNHVGQTMFADPDLIIEAIEHPDIGVLKSLTFTGVDVNRPNADNIVPIIMAAVKGDLERIQILVEAGADVNTQEADQWTPLMFVASDGSLEVAKYLLFMGASPFYRNSNGMSAHDIARLRGHRELAFFLSNVELLMALDEADTEVILRALDHGADHNLANGNGFTALLHMCSVGEHDIVLHMIAEFGDDYTRAENDGWTCLAFAAFRGDMATLEYLLTLPGHSNDDLLVAQRKARGNRQYQAVQRLQQLVEERRESEEQRVLRQPSVQVLHGVNMRPVPQMRSNGSSQQTPKLHHSLDVGVDMDLGRPMAPSTHGTAAAGAEIGSGTGYFNIQNHEEQQSYHL